jgi:hypothetical protein
MIIPEGIVDGLEILLVIMVFFGVYKLFVYMKGKH